MRKNLLLVSALGICAACAALVFAFGQHNYKAPPAFSTAPPQVIALATITPGEAVIEINAPASSGETRIRRQLVHENDKVKAGQILAVLDSEERLKAALEEARAEYAAKQADLNKALAGNSPFEVSAQQAAVERFSAELAQKKRELSRFEEMHKAGIISEQEYETHALDYQTASEQLKNARALLNHTAEVRPVDIAVARAALQVAGASIREAEANLAQAYIRAPVAGQVLRIHVWPGERIADGGLLDLAPISATYAIAEVYETDVTKLHVGQRALIEADTLAKPLGGTVARIASNVQRQQTVDTDPAANTDARVVRVYVTIRPEEAESARQFINLQVAVRFL